MKGLSSTERRELEDTTRALEDPAQYEKQIEETADEIAKATRQDST
jgi:hypothetical protein